MLLLYPGELYRLLGASSFSFSSMMHAVTQQKQIYSTGYLVLTETRLIPLQFEQFKLPFKLKYQPIPPRLFFLFNQVISVKMFDF
jgi:hypothetical protein